MKLNGYQRIGVVISVAWLLFGFFYGDYLARHEGDWATNLYTYCMGTKDMPSYWYEECSQAFDRNSKVAFEIYLKVHWWYSLVVATVPIILGWLLTYAGIGIVKWIIRGFKKARP